MSFTGISIKNLTQSRSKEPGNRSYPQWSLHHQWWMGIWRSHLAGGLFPSPFLLWRNRLLLLNLTIILYSVYLKKMKHKWCHRKMEQQLYFKLVTGLSAPATSCNRKITQRTLSCNIRITSFERVTCLHCMTELFDFLHYFLYGSFELT